MHAHDRISRGAWAATVLGAVLMTALFWVVVYLGGWRVVAAGMGSNDPWLLARALVVFIALGMWALIVVVCWAEVFHGRGGRR